MSQSVKKDNVIIVGAGVSGLVCAIELEKRGVEPLIIDTLPKVGGRLQTVMMDDIPLDKGFQVLLSAYPAAQKYLDMEALDLVSFRPGAVVFKGASQYRMGDPLRDSGFLIDTLRFPFGTLRDKFKVWKLTRELKNKEVDEIFSSSSVSTLSYLEKRGFSRQMIDSFFEPFFGGIFLEDKLSTSSRMFEFVFKMFAEGKATLPKRGIQEIAFQLKAKLKQSRFMMNTEVLSFANGMLQLKNGNSVAYDKLFLASANKLLDKDAHTQSWQSCINVYFECSSLYVEPDLIALSCNKGLINNFSFIKGREGQIVMSLTVLKDYKAKDEDLINELRKELKTSFQMEVGDCIQLNRIQRALPKIKELKSEASPSSYSLGDQVYTCGDFMANASLNAAMLSGANAVKEAYKS